VGPGGIGPRDGGRSRRAGEGADAAAEIANVTAVFDVQRTVPEETDIEVAIAVHVVPDPVTVTVPWPVSL